jgi:hypothetical protein
VIARMNAFSAFSSSQNDSENRKLKKPWNKERRRKKKSKVSLILLHVNHTFFILDLWIEPQAFRHIHNTLGKFGFLNVKKGPIQGSICFKLVPELLIPRPLFKEDLILKNNPIPILIHKIKPGFDLLTKSKIGNSYSPN